MLVTGSENESSPRFWDSKIETIDEELKEKCPILKYRRKTLTKEERQELMQLEDQLAMILAKGDELTEQDEKRLRDIQKQIEKLTGVPFPKHASLTKFADVMKKTNGKSEEDEKEEEEQNANSILDLKRTQTAIEAQGRRLNMPVVEESEGPGLMDVLAKMAATWSNGPGASLGKGISRKI